MDRRAPTLTTEWHRSVQSISDRRLKENITDAKSQWDDIKALKWKNFNWTKESGHDDGKPKLGLIADEVEKVSPNLINIDAQPKEDIDAGKEVHLNLSNVQYMDSSGISVLIESHQKALEKNTKVIIKDVSKSVLKVIMMAKLEQILNLE